jgi:hypothetical protein
MSVGTGTGAVVVSVVEQRAYRDHGRYGVSIRLLVPRRLLDHRERGRKGWLSSSELEDTPQWSG